MGRFVTDPPARRYAYPKGLGAPLTILDGSGDIDRAVLHGKNCHKSGSVEDGLKGLCNRRLKFRTGQPRNRNLPQERQRYPSVVLDGALAGNFKTLNKAAREIGQALMACPFVFLMLYPLEDSEVNLIANAKRCTGPCMNRLRVLSTAGLRRPSFARA